MGNTKGFVWKLYAERWGAWNRDGEFRSVESWDAAVKFALSEAR